MREMRKRHNCRSTLAICKHSPERVLPAKHQTRRAGRTVIPWRHVWWHQNHGDNIASSVSTCRAPSPRVSVASGTVRKSKSISSFFTAFLVYLKSGSTELRAPMSAVAKQRRSCKVPDGKARRVGWAGEHTPFRRSVGEMCVGCIALALGLGTRGRRQGIGVDIDQGRNEKRGESCFPMNVPYQYHTRQPGKCDWKHRNARSFSHVCSRGSNEAKLR